MNVEAETVLEKCHFLTSFWEKQPRASVNSCFVDKSHPGSQSGCSAETALIKAHNDCFPLEVSVQ